MQKCQLERNPKPAQLLELRLLLRVSHIHATLVRPVCVAVHAGRTVAHPPDNRFSQEHCRIIWSNPKFSRWKLQTSCPPSSTVTNVPFLLKSYFRCLV